MKFRAHVAREIIDADKSGVIEYRHVTRMIYEGGDDSVYVAYYKHWEKARPDVHAFLQATGW